MTITIGSDSLCDGADRAVDKSAGPSGLSLSGAIGAQVQENLRADDVVIYNRKNRRSDLSFGVKRQCASIGAAETWAMLHPVTVTRSGTVTMTTGAGAVKMLNAVLTTVKCSTVGSTVLVDYAIAGGKLEQ